MNDHKEKESLFKDFQEVKPSAWKEKMLQDLNGLSFEKLIWVTNDGIEVKPFYSAEDLDKLKIPNNIYRNISVNSTSGWEIRQDIIVDDIQKANAIALNALNWGATSIGFIIPEDRKLSRTEFSLLLQDIHFDCIYVHFLTQSHAKEIFEFLLSEISLKNYEPSGIMGSLDNDPLGFLTMKGMYPQTEEKEISFAATLINQASSQLPNFKTLGINGHLFHNAGATIIQELGFSLALISEYFDLLTKKGLKPEAIAKSMQMNLAVGPVYFMEIAKIRAARFLFAKLAGAWDIKDEEVLKIFIHCYTSEWNQTVYDPYNNMLRSTTESMSAVLGGCDSLTVTPFDKPFRRTTKFSERIARNTQIILKEEAWLDRVNDPSAGSYFIENITESIITESWKIFLEIEESGGYLSAFKAGEIQKRIAKSAANRDQAIAFRKEVLLGTNQYPDPNENLPEDFDVDIALPRKEKTGLLAQPLVKYRGAEAFEILRQNAEKVNKKVFLLPIGNKSWSKARASFSANFFACGGFEITENSEFDEIGSGISAALSEKASIIVLCSSDEEYIRLATEANKILAQNAILVIAGYPKDSLEELKDKGITNFIHVKSNVLEELQKYQNLLGMTQSN